MSDTMTDYRRGTQSFLMQTGKSSLAQPIENKTNTPVNDHFKIEDQIGFKNYCFTFPMAKCIPVMHILSKEWNNIRGNDYAKIFGNIGIN